ncbi:acyl-CoA thioesterase [Exophiala xenobiotica]|uniref:Acyl-CoA thioesterase n=1 Tax=Vermiconidia calcicola TaxID=1690605 RepID=A0AAV9Q2R1_9PEZI|nr:acyl-CoA thioesterase [Exophiala xenobiotica]KAK5533957.1 acyl-CoA thioesterase [Vermiconidia calcicola]KAK5546508.1 acyl-CoA thioesterase [Chaetothyriales sp. CCFEE 6169]KAK5292490.1 acyl-CoA thioesterase [Exophiala xenobiotica]KAK5342167.1 acyl-CoA thioesterase [Exophiala xenobiotica]
MGQDEVPTTKQLDFETHIELKQIGPDTFTSIHQPWLFHITFTVPGPLMMAEAASAAYKTVPDGFMLDTLQTHFMLAPDSKKPLVYKVQRLSQGRRFAVRLVNIEQDDGRICVTITTSFMSGASWTGRAMTHAESMRTTQRIRDITLDDFEENRSHLGPFMKFERLPHVQHVVPPDPSTTIAPVVAKIDPPIKAPTGSLLHLLGMIYLSDYHVMDCPLTIHGVDSGLFAIGDHTRNRPSSGSMMKIMTSLNHTVHFHAHDGFRADELVYIEATSPWAKDGRALIHSKMFSHNGLLIATCVQEAFYVFKDAAKL